VDPRGGIADESLPDAQDGCLGVPGTRGDPQLQDRCSPMRLLLNILGGILLLGLSCTASGGEIQFDVFIGHDGIVRPGSWNPAVVEILNTGATRDGIVEVSADRMGAATVRVPVELPTQSRKRLSVPFFCTGTGVECRLLDRDGRVLEQRSGGQIQSVQWNAPLVGSLADSPQGGPSLPGEAMRDVESDQPRVVRLRPEMFPDTALALESLSSVYLSPTKALALREGQITSLLQWVACGGQLIVGLDRPGDYASLSWLRAMGVPMPRGDERILTEPEMRRWLDEGPWNPDFAFRSIPSKESVVPTNDPGSVPSRSSSWGEPIHTQYFALERGKGRGDDSIPWMSVRGWGRGQLVVLGFNPEREPMRSWELRARFWSKLCAIPPVPASASTALEKVLTGLDLLFADLVDTRQIRKVPISILLALLVLYLAVIGPGDRWFLGRLRRPMLTWVTFPTYILVFSGLIYLIGYRLRSGQTEWNELQIVDVIPRQGDAPALLRGRTYGGLYSPATGIYPLALAIPDGGMRSELRNLFGVRLDSGRVATSLGATGTEAEVQASLWMKNLVVAEWVDEGPSPIVLLDEGEGRFRLQNRTGKQLGPVWLVHDGRVTLVGALESGGAFDWVVGMVSTPLDEVLAPALNGLPESLSRRDRPIAGEPGAESQGHSLLAMASGFCGRMDAAMPEEGAILWPRGFDLQNPMDSGRLVVLAWVPDPGLLPELNRFPASRGRRESLLRLTVPLSTRIPASRSP